MGPEAVVSQLGLQQLDHEGGWFRRIYTGECREGERAYATTIYALFTRSQFSALHRLDAVEQFFFLDGDPFEVFRISLEGVGEATVLGRDFARGERPHLAFKAGEWFGGAPIATGSLGWTLMSCVVTPGFAWEGFELGKRSELLKTYPNYGDKILELTRD